MNWQAWLQVALAGLGAFNPALAGLISTITGAIAQVGGDLAAVEATSQKWIAVIQKIVDEKRDPTPEEFAQVKAFADEVHAKIQAG